MLDFRGRRHEVLAPQVAHALTQRCREEDEDAGLQFWLAGPYGLTVGGPPFAFRILSANPIIIKGERGLSGIRGVRLTYQARILPFIMGR